jgi:DNA-binding transcriptional MerR regulator
MSSRDTLRTSDLARAAGISVQQVRNYEAWGFLPPAARSAAGYRRYTARHLQALRTARTLMAGYGWAPARRAMEAVHRGDLDTAVAVVDERHAELDGQRRVSGQTLDALRAVSGGLDMGDASAGSLERRTIGDVARELGVRVSALRFWEQQGLVAPARERASGYRRYGPEEVRQLKVVVLMRRNGYPAETIRSVLAELAAGHPARAIAAAEQRLHELAAASRRCMQATAALWAYVDVQEEPSA